MYQITEKTLGSAFHEKRIAWETMKGRMDALRGVDHCGCVLNNGLIDKAYKQIKLTSLTFSKLCKERDLFLESAQDTSQGKMQTLQQKVNTAKTEFQNALKERVALTNELNSYVTQWDNDRPLAGPYVDLCKELQAEFMMFSKK